MKTKAIKMAGLTGKVPAVVDTGSNSCTAVLQGSPQEKISSKQHLGTPLPEPKRTSFSSSCVPLALGASVLMVFLPLLQTDLWWVRSSIHWAVLGCKAVTVVKAIAVIAVVGYKLDLKASLTHLVKHTRDSNAPSSTFSGADRTKASEVLHALVVLTLVAYACCMPWVGGLAHAVFGEVRQQGMYLDAFKFIWMYPYTSVVLELVNLLYRCAALSHVLLLVLKLPCWMKCLAFDELYRLCICLVVLCSALLATYLTGHY